MGDAASTPATQHGRTLLWSGFPGVQTPETILHEPQPRTQGSQRYQSCHSPPCFSGCSRPRVSGCTRRTFLRHHIPCRANPRENAPACTAAPRCASLARGAAEPALASPGPSPSPTRLAAPAGFVPFAAARDPFAAQICPQQSLKSSKTQTVAAKALPRGLLHFTACHAQAPRGQAGLSWSIHKGHLIFSRPGLQNRTHVY